ncbi:PrsW family glutamic-type intramembrane protease [Candidatus Chlorohelix sp.]|uniref:PrsW family intramembrane metalloprotease n=1 Tax=Candidatus Chlorohelix sp. TaxID=3139201 RepID=UPI0030619187
MEFIIVFLASLLPGLFWMWWYYRQDKYEKEPKRLLAFVFICGIPLSLLIGLFEYSVDQAGKQGNTPLSQSGNILSVILFYLLIVSLTEELGKLAITYFLAYRNPAFNEPVDGIIYAAASGLGFATFENVFFIINEGPLIILLRGPVSTLGHVLFSAMWGAALGLAKFDHLRTTARKRVVVGFILAVITHAIFDLIIALGQRIAEWVALSSVLFMGLLYLVVSRQIAALLNLSQFKPATIASQTLHNLRQRSSSENNQHYVPNPYLRKPEIDLKEDEQDR